MGITLLYDYCDSILNTYIISNFYLLIDLSRLLVVLKHSSHKVSFILDKKKFPQDEHLILCSSYILFVYKI